MTGPGASPSAEAYARETSSLLDTLDVERSVVFGHGVAGGRMPADSVPAVRAAELAHSARVSTLQRLLADRNEPVPPAPTWYDVPAATDARSATSLLVGLEESTARAWRVVVEVTVPPDPDGLRDLGSYAVSDAATRATGWRIELASMPTGTEDTQVAAAQAAATLGAAAPAWPGA